MSALAPRVGDVIAGKYRIERPLGEGGMAVVFAATHLGLGRSVALKFVRPWALGEDEMRQRFMREAHATFSLRSEHAIRMLDLGELPTGDLFLVMELLEGSNLAEVIHKRGPIPEAEAARFIQQACDALGEAHALGIVHRDLKPANLFLTTTHTGKSSVKVLDFGLAKITGSTGPGSVAPLTGIATTLGTPKYMAPEQWERATRVDGRADIFSLGVILFQLLTGKVPHEDLPLDERLRKILAGAVPSPRGLRPEISETMARVVMRCLRPIPEERFASAAELADALSYTHETSGPGAPRPPIAALNATGITAVVPDAVRRAVQREVDVKQGFGSAAAASVSPNNLASAVVPVQEDGRASPNPPAAAGAGGASESPQPNGGFEPVRTERMTRATVMQNAPNVQTAPNAQVGGSPSAPPAGVRGDALNRTLLSGQGTAPQVASAAPPAPVVPQVVTFTSIAAPASAPRESGKPVAAAAPGPQPAQVQSAQAQPAPRTEPAQRTQLAQAAQPVREAPAGPPAAAAPLPMSGAFGAHRPAPAPATRAAKRGGAVLVVVAVFLGCGVLGSALAAGVFWLRGAASPATSVAPPGSSIPPSPEPPVAAPVATPEQPPSPAQPAKKRAVVAPHDPVAPAAGGVPAKALDDRVLDRSAVLRAPAELAAPTGGSATTAPLVPAPPSPTGTASAPAPRTDAPTPVPSGRQRRDGKGSNANGPKGGFSLGF